MKILVLLFLWLPVISLGQDILIDFEENDLTGWLPSQEGNWCISEEAPLEGYFSLKHCYNSDSAGWDQVSFFHDPLLLTGEEASWQFEIRHAYPPSSNNHWAIILSDKEIPVQGHLRGYGLVIGVNFKGNSDELKVWGWKEGEFRELLNTGFNWQENQPESAPACIELHKSISGEYHLKLYTSAEERSFSQGFYFDEAASVNVFTLFYKYTASYDQGLWMDMLHISGAMIRDHSPPELLAVYTLSSHTVELQFNEIVIATPDSRVCVFDLGCSETGAGYSDNFKLRLPFDLTPGYEYSLELPQLSDMYGNTPEETDWVEDFYYPAAYDVLISEIMADPSPQVLLPEAEYIELTNVSGRELHFKGGKLHVNNRTCKLPVLHMLPDERVLLADVDQIHLFTNVSSKQAISGFPAFNNKGAQLVLCDASGSLMHAVRYSENWHSETSKRAGGWSLEMVQLDDPCSGEGNWTSSEDYRGGSPGMPNSVQGEGNRAEPELWRAAVAGTSSLMLYFSEPLDSMSLIDKRCYSVDRGIGHPVQIFPSWPLAKEIELKFDTDFMPDLRYEIRLTADICDCSGDQLGYSASQSFRIPGLADFEDILINEILFAPEPGQVEFVEVYNASDHTIDLKGFRLLVNEAEDTTGIICHEFWPLDAGEYALISASYTGIDNPEEFELEERIIYMPEMPVLPNSGARLYLKTHDNKLSDVAGYSPDLHHPLLMDTRGVSLERLSPNLSGTSPDNWLSASSDAGYMTPATTNSQAETNATGCRVMLDTDLITPNDDGAQERIGIQYELDTEGYMGQVFIYDIKGLRRKTLANGLLLGTRGEFVFDGRGEAGETLPTGYYILVFNAYHDSGRQCNKKLSFVLAK